MGGRWLTGRGGGGRRGRIRWRGGRLGGAVGWALGRLSRRRRGGFGGSRMGWLVDGLVFGGGVCYA